MIKTLLFMEIESLPFAAGAREWQRAEVSKREEVYRHSGQAVKLPARFHFLPAPAYPLSEPPPVCIRILDRSTNTYAGGRFFIT